jgi:germination protein M
MTKRVAVLGIAALAVAALATWGVMTFRTPGDAPLPEPAPRPAPPATATATPHITATLFYASPDGVSLVPVRREVPLAEGLEAQGTQILTAQLAATPPHVSVIPKGTTLRAFYVTERGEAFVDLSSEVSTAHPGGSLAELLTVYAVVNAVTTNLPKVQRVQLLVDGKEVETIAGHVDVSRPLARDASLVRAR